MRTSTSRRRLVLGIGAAAAAASLPAAIHAAMGPNDKFDLVIKGGEIVDPSQNLRGVRDIGIRNGVIEVVQADIPAERAVRVINASGRRHDQVARPSYEYRESMPPASRVSS